VLISGALHGDERIGPATALALSQWLVERYDSDPWVRRLVDTRIVLIMPMTNAIGVERRTRAELNIDPNRDFPYDQAPSNCMATIAARSLNEVYRARLLQLVITFHGGMQAIGYNWGSFNYYKVAPALCPCRAPASRAHTARSYRAPSPLPPTKQDSSWTVSQAQHRDFGLVPVPAPAPVPVGAGSQGLSLFSPPLCAGQVASQP
jgi:hypothetical protein